MTSDNTLLFYCIHAYLFSFIHIYLFIFVSRFSGVFRALTASYRSSFWYYLKALGHYIISQGAPFGCCGVLYMLLDFIIFIIVVIITIIIIIVVAVVVNVIFIISITIRILIKSSLLFLWVKLTIWFCFF